jgi:guanosine-3',5'-bis(diphosphate) 3'-pyrophosphohydrolase
MYTKEENNIIKEILDNTPDRFEDDVKLAIEFIFEKLKGAKRFTGEPFTNHLLNVGLNVARLKLDTHSIITGLLHQVMSDRFNNKKDIQKIREEIIEKFDPEVLDLLDKTEMINQATKIHEKTNYKTVSSFILKSSKDLRPALIKLCDIQDEVKTLEAIPKEKQKGFANKIFDLYGPLAEYLNLNDMKKELEETAFIKAYSKDAQFIKDKLDENNINEELKDDIQVFLNIMLGILGYKADVFSRIKSMYSINRKFKKYFEEGINADIKRMRDLIGYTIILSNKKQCLELAEALKDLTEVNMNELDDYITNPKPNGYSAFQLTTKIPEITDIEVEIQIMTHEMYFTNTYGTASHYAYKEQFKRYAKASNEFIWLKDLHDAINEHINRREDHKSIIIPGKVFKDQIFAITPKGRLIQLNKGATVLDFAYRIHNDIGKMAISGIINGVPAKLDTKVKSGEVVEVVIDRRKG